MRAHSGPASYSTTWKLTRRCFLALCAAGCTRPHRAWSRMPPEETTWALLSDPHISAHADAAVRGDSMARHLGAAVAGVVALAPQRVLVNGDLAFACGAPSDYAAFQELTSAWRRAGIPSHVTVGNHDHRGHLAEALAVPGVGPVPDKVVSSFLVGGTHWILLDSLETVNAVRGSLGAAQRLWLAEQLDQAPRTPAVVCLHHNPELSLVGLKDTREFAETVGSRRQVKLVLFGHTHEFRVWQDDGLHFVNLPAVGYRFRPAASLGWLVARVRSDGVTLEFRGVSGSEPEHGHHWDLRWRDESAG